MARDPYPPLIEHLTDTIARIAVEGKSTDHYGIVRRSLGIGYTQPAKMNPSTKPAWTGHCDKGLQQ